MENSHKISQQLRILTILLILFLTHTILTNAQNAVGSVNGALTVNDMGAAVYSMTFDAPNGGRMTPKIGLAYSSQSSGYGLAGYGIDVTGISVITSGGRDMFHNGRVRGANYDADSNFYLDGKRLILESDTETGDSTIYSVEGDPYTKVVRHGEFDHEKPQEKNGCVILLEPTAVTAWFEVIRNDGSRCYFGKDDNSRLIIKGIVPFRGDRCAAWYISKAVNRYGESISYAYINEDLCVRPLTITYGTERDLTAKVEFFYRDMAGANVRTFRIGSQQGMRSKLLSSVTTSINNQVHRKYDFTYDETASDKFSRLTTITESNGVGESLNPTVLTWNTSPSVEVAHTDVTGYQTKLSDAWGVDEGDNGYMTVDLNGDGIADMVRVCNGKTGSQSLGWRLYQFFYVYTGYIGPDNKVHYGSPSRFDMPRPVNWVDFIRNTMGSASVMDHDGDGYNDLVYPVYTNEDGRKYETLYFLFGKDVVRGGYGLSMPCSNVSVVRADAPMCRTGLDINGDGRDDLIGVEKSGDAGKFRMTLLSCKEVNKDGMPQEDYKEKDITLPSNPKRLFTGDYNGDGLLDLFFACESGYAIYYNNGYTKGQNILNAFTSDNRYEGNTVRDYWRMEQGDFDGDGLVDFFCHDKDSRQFLIAYYNGDGTFRKQTLTDNWGIYEQSETDKDDRKFSVIVTDFDEDGKSDVVLVKACYKREIMGRIVYDRTQVRWLHSTGSGLELAKAYGLNGEDQSAENRILMSDFDGDGKTEFASMGILLDASNSVDDEGTMHIYKTGAADASDGRLTTVTDGFGNATELSYAYATDKTVYTQSQEPQVQREYDITYTIEKGKLVPLSKTLKSEVFVDAYPVNRYTLPIALVSSVKSADTDISYSYKDLRLHIAGRGILGFGTTTKTDNIRGVMETSEVTKWNTQYWHPGETTTTRSISGTGETSKTVSCFVIENGGVSYNSGNVHTDYDGNKKYENMCLDGESGLVMNRSVKHGENGSAIYSEEIFSDFVCLNGVWRPQHKDVENFYDEDGNSALSYEDYEYDVKGNLTKVITTGLQLDDAQWDYEEGGTMEKEYTYDRWGNVTSETFHGNDETTGYKYYEYDPTGRFIVKTYTVPESTTTTYTYGIFGNVLTETDVTDASNPLTTTHEYDGWGRRTATTYADGTVSGYETGWSSVSSTGGYYTMESHTAAPWVKTTYDSRGRKVMTETIGANKISVSETTEYDAKGQVAAVTSRYGQRVSTETFGYDARGRVISDRHSSGASMTYEYGADYVKSTDAAGRSVTKTFDAAGNVQTVTDPAQTVTYHYYSNGKPRTITVDNTTTELEYDAFGRRTKLIDPDAGAITTTYCKNGQVSSETDGRGVTTTYTYDALGRVTQRKREGYVSGNRFKETENTTYTYGTDGNSKGRIVEKKKNGWSSIRYEYDKYGRITAEVRPNTFCHCGNRHDLRKSYTYNSLGQVSSVIYPTIHYYGGLEVKYNYDNYGYKRSESYGNQILSMTSSLSANKTGMNDIKYSSTFGWRYTVLDKDGYPTRQYYKKNGVLEDMHYTWDKLTGNLTSKAVNGVTENYSYDDLDRLVGVDGINPLSVTYAANGNITNKSDIGNYTYNPADKPHAVREIDNLGNNTSPSDNNVSYTLSGKPGWIYDYSYSYGPDDEKWGYGRIDPDDPETKYWDIDKVYWENYECVMKDFHYREYYFLDNDVIIIRDSHDDDGGEYSWLEHPATVEIYQAVTDHLGSIIAVYDKSQRKVYEASYDAWGRQTVTLDEIELYRGYTGHENIGRTELVHMDGRMYDSSTGRFLSPDNYVQLPENSQSFNRYSYCINNPLKYTDPTGQFFQISFIGASLLAANAFANAMTTDSGSKFFVSSAISIFSPAVAGAIGGMFGHSVGSFGNELLRAGAHGLASGVANALTGENFGAGFASGAFASFAGSGAQWAGLGKGGVLGATTLFGGIGSAAFGGDFLAGAMTGLNIGLYNHNGGLMGKEASCERLPDGTFIAPGELQEVIVKPSVWQKIARFASNLSLAVGAADHVSKNARIGSNNKMYFRHSNNRIFHSNQHVTTKALPKIPHATGVGTGLSVVAEAPNVMEAYYLHGLLSRETGRAVTVAAGRVAGGFYGAKYGIVIGSGIGSAICEGAGTVVGGVAGSIAGGYYGSKLGGYASGILFDMIF
ncbi:MAG: VCBS repeat-containing protein [Prevotella sp.]|nr:VCBS repeat-containing protein [Prevotella sp.]